MFLLANLSMIEETFGKTVSASFLSDSDLKALIAVRADL